MISRDTVLVIVMLYMVTPVSTGCTIVIRDADEVRDQFLQMLDDGIKLVYMDLNVSGNFSEYIQSLYSDDENNGLLRWMWTKKGVSFLLSYPDKFPAVTFNLLKGVYVDNLRVNMNFSSSCNMSYEHFTNAINIMLYNKLFANQSNWMMCHRHFKDQSFKVLINMILSYWIGYDMECFNSDCEDGYPLCKSFIRKSAINYVLIAFLITVGLYSPLLFLLLPQRLNDDKSLQDYCISDTPYSISRIFQNIAKCENRSVWDTNTWFGAEHRLILSFMVCLCAFQYLQMYLVATFIPDYHLFESTYGYIGDFTLFLFPIPLKLLGLFIPSYLVMLVAFSWFLSYIMERFTSNKKNTYFVPAFIKVETKYSQFENETMPINCRVKRFVNKTKTFRFKVLLADIDKLDLPEHEPKYYGYTAFAHKFLKRICFVFDSRFYLSLFKPLYTNRHGRRGYQTTILICLFPFALLLNFILCFFPIFNFFLAPLTQQRNCATYVATTVNLLSSVILYCNAIVSVLSFLLQILIFNIFVIVPMYDASFKYWAVSIAAMFYSVTLYKDFVGIYQNLLEKCLEKTAEKKISISKFQKIVETIHPVRIQIAWLVAKLLMSAVFFYALIDLTFIKNYGTDTFFYQRIPFLIGIIIPVVVLRLYGMSAKQQIEKHSSIIENILAEEPLGSGNNEAESGVIKIQWKLLPWRIPKVNNDDDDKDDKDYIVDKDDKENKNDKKDIRCCSKCTLSCKLLTPFMTVLWVLYYFFAFAFPCIFHSLNPSCTCRFHKDEDDDDELKRQLLDKNELFSFEKLV